MIKFYVVADGRGLADDDPRTVVDKEMRIDLGARMNIDSRALVPVFGEHAGQQWDLQLIEYMRDALERDGEHARVSDNDFFYAASRGVAFLLFSL